MVSRAATPPPSSLDLAKALAHAPTLVEVASESGAAQSVRSGASVADAGEDDDGDDALTPRDWRKLKAPERKAALFANTSMLLRQAENDYSVKAMHAVKPKPSVVKLLCSHIAKLSNMIARHCHGEESADETAEALFEASEHILFNSDMLTHLRDSPSKYLGAPMTSEVEKFS